MKLFVDSRSGVPIYKQLIQQIEKGIVGGILSPGDQLPTVREVALILTINPNTVARAYRELELRGIIESVQGRGTYIAENLPPPRGDEKETMIRQMIENIISESAQLGIDNETLLKLFNEVLAEQTKEA